jgi:lipopolysaccharide/colanic/teichoic acid biosynthesis glycosyltransferase
MTPTSLITAKGKDRSPAAAPHTAATVGDGFAVGAPALPVRTARRQGASLALKQAVDFGGAALVLLVSSPLFFLAALAIKLTSAGPVFFVQQRLGRGGRSFRCYKFRTMKHNSDDGLHREFARNFIRGGPSEAHGNGHGNGHGKNGHGSNVNGNNGNGHGRNGASATVYKLTKDPRITRVGQLLRRTSLDELPQILNVLRGEMSLVGPRPPVPYELDDYQDWHKRRLSAKPGITGLWQVSGRSSVPFDEMVQLDLYYIDHRSTLMDLWIMARTLPVMIKGDGAY